MANTNWENLPSTNTPINATNLNKISQGLANVGTSVDNTYKTNILKGNNLFNKNNFSQFTGYVSKTNNKLVFGSENDKTLYIPIKPNTQYTISKIATNPFYICTSTSIADNTPVSNAENLGNVATTYTIISGPNDKYLCLTYYNQNSTQTQQAILDSIMINEGSTATTYQPFVQKQMIVDDTKFTDTINVGTSVDSTYKTNILYSKNLFDKNNPNIIYGSFSSTDPISVYNVNVKSVYISCKPNTTYTISKSNVTNRFRAGTTSTLPASSVSVNDVVTNDSGTSITITTGTNAKYLIVYYWSSSDSTDIVLNSLQIEYGSVATTYEAYITPSIVVDGDEIYSQPSDTNWKKISLNSGYTGELYVRKIENIVSVIGLNISGSFTGGTSFATIPEGFRPSMQINYVGRNTANENVLIINQNSVGAIRTGSNISNGVLQFSSTYMIN